ncbi:MAG: XRE family transcriptional regulator [Oleiphilus sp.]|nr:MAG: XRE family transcriptional regulator [Oleiphilus sp.]
MLGDQIRTRRELLKDADRRYSLRQVAGRVGIEPAYLSKIERNEVPPPGEETIKKISRDLELDPDVMLAMAGKISSDLQEIIRKRPLLFSKMLRALKEAPDHAILEVVREVTDGDW